MIPQRITLVGAPVELGAGLPGCAMGPDSLRVAGLKAALVALGHEVEDQGNVAPICAGNAGLRGNARNAENVIGWTRTLEEVAQHVLKNGRLPIFMGGDHALAMGTVAGVARHARDERRPLCVLWLDAHADFNTPMTSESGNMHGMPVAFYCGEPGFEGVLSSDHPTVDPSNVFMVGIRSVDTRERELIAARGVHVFDMRTVDEFGVAAIMRRILAQVERQNAMLHVSLDVDFLDPVIAPGVGTAVNGGANLREAHLIMEMLYESGLTTSMDLAELNPFLDDRGRSARLLVDLTASLFGRSVLDKVATATSMQGLQNVA
ncbi:MAG: arginase [Pseudomonadota bacterium]